MTTQQIEQFRTELKVLITLNSDIAENRQYLVKLHRWDKHGSHQTAILTAMGRRDELLATQKEMLKGHKYAEWQATSRKISGLQARLKRAATDNTKNKIDALIYGIKFTL